MPVVSFDNIIIGSSYSRAQLATLWGYDGIEGLARGVVTPKNDNKILLFVTQEKQSDRTQYEGGWSGRTLSWEGPTNHFAEERMLSASSHGDEIHLFYRDRHHTDFEYHGEMFVVGCEQLLDRPSRFVLTKDAIRRCWLLLEKSDDTRVSKSIGGYRDKTGEVYHYDSLVPNFKNLKRENIVVIRKENEILGTGTIGEIEVSDEEKIHRRCPACKGTDIRERTAKTPRWKCGKCRHEFAEPEETVTPVRSFTAQIIGFARFDSPPLVSAVKNCAIGGNGGKSQLSILELDSGKLATLLQGIDISPSPRSMDRRSGQGFGLSQAERRAVEQLAMRIATEFYESQGWQVIDTSRSNSFDLLATQNNQRRYIEVKGTTGDGSSVILTHGEVQHVRHHPQEAVLIVVANIQLQQIDGEWIASNGNIATHAAPWQINSEQLQATRYQYRVEVPPTDKIQSWRGTTENGGS